MENPIFCAHFGIRAPLGSKRRDPLTKILDPPLLFAIVSVADSAMSQTENPTDEANGQESEDSQADAPKPPTIEELRAAAAAQDSLKEADEEIQKAAAAAAAALTGNNQAENQNQNRAKKAQKTKGRVKINAPAATANQEAQPQQQQTKKKQKHQPDPAEEDEEEEDDVEEIDDEPSKLIPAILGCFQAIGNFFKKIFRFILYVLSSIWALFFGLLKLIWNLFCKLVPLLVGVPLYCLVLHLTSEYVVPAFSSDHQLDMGVRLNYLLRCHAFTMLPVLLGKKKKIHAGSEMSSEKH